MLPVFLFGFFSVFVSSFLKVLLFLGVVRRGFLSDLVFRMVGFGEMCWDLLFFGGFLMMIFRCLGLCWFFASELRSSRLRFRSELPSGRCPAKIFSLASLVSSAIFVRNDGLLEAPC